MAVTASLHQTSLPNNLQEHNNSVDPNQYITTFFCRAMYDYQSKDPSSLSFHKGDIIEVLTQLDSGWWDGLLYDERGWFPSNYVAPVSDLELEEELRAARVEQEDTGWTQDGRTEPGGPPSDFWVPRVDGTGRIFYVNTQTGEQSNELPTEVESDAEPVANVYTSSTGSTVTTVSSFARSSMATTPSDSPVAGFGLPKRSGTPEPWVKRLADDGMSYYYLNTIDGSIRWTAPSPQLDLPRAHVHDMLPLLDGHERTDSAATRDRLSIYSDDSDIKPLGILGRVHAQADSILTAETPTRGYQQDELPDVSAARELQAILEERFAPPLETLDDLAQTAKVAIMGLLDVALARSNNVQVKDSVKRTTDAIRNLVYASSTLIGPLTSLPSPYATNTVASDVVELKPYHRKVTATMIKLISAVRASASDMQSDNDLTARLEADSNELERAIATFVNEVLSRRTPQQAARRVRAVFSSAEGARGVGLGLLGAGAGGRWKGFGFVEPLVGEQLIPELIVTMKEHKAKVDDTLVELEAFLAGEVNLFLGQEAVQSVVSFLGLVAEINVARALDLDSSSAAVPDPSYIQSVARAKVLVRGLEGAVQAVFEDGAVLFNASQLTTSTGNLTRPISQGEVHPLDILRAAIPAIRGNVEDACTIIEALLVLAQYQADTCAKAGLDGSIGLRDAYLRVRGSGATNSDAIPGVRDTLRPDVAMDYEIGYHEEHSYEGDTVNFVDALSSRPETRERARDDTAAIFGASLHGQSDTSIDKLYQSVRAGQRDRSGSQSESVDSFDKDRPTTGTSRGQPMSQASTLVGNETPPPGGNESGQESDDDFLGPSKSPRRQHKIKAILGGEAPDAYIKMANAELKPWYLRAEHGAKDIYINPDGGVRGGTLPALIERLTMHDTRDAGFISTFLVTFKSFTTLDGVFDGLVKRFNLQPPSNLSPDELKEWTREKQVIVRLRVLNIFRSMVIEEDVLEKEDMGILDRIKDFATAVEQEIVPSIPAAKQLLVLIDRAQSGGDSMVKMRQVTSNFPPPSIIPKTNKAMKLLDIDPLELARQLTIMESKLFCKIRPIECLNRGRDGKPGDSDDNISAIIDTSNKVAEWVADAVLSKDDSRKRAAIMKQFIAVADRCRHLQNFSTMAAVVAGLNSPPLRRLKRTWEQVNARSKTQLQEAERTMDTNKNFTNYRAILKGAQLPCVPFFGVYLSVLTFIQDGNKNIIQGEIINFGKRDKFAEVIREIKHYQSKPYNLTSIQPIQNYIDEQLSALGNTADLSDRAWNLSLEREPREREDEKMARLLQESGFL